MNKTTILRAKRIRQYIIANPGCTKDEIYAAHPDEKLTGGFEVLERHGLARFEGGGKKGPARWFPREAIPKNMEPIREDDHQ
jgi:hypothetical protein